MANIKKIQFPKDLLGIDNINGRYGNEFMIMYINEKQNGSFEYKPSNGTPLVIKNTNGEILRAGKGGKEIEGSIVDEFFTVATGGRMRDNRSVPTKTTHAIFLPVPLDIKDSFGVEYTEWAAANDPGVQNLIKGAVQKSFGMAKNIAGKSNPQLGKNLYRAGKFITSDEIKTLGNLGMITQGLSINPHKELLFQGVKMRSFNFSYKLIATNNTESETVKEIINLLRFHMHPSLTAGSVMFEYPSEFDCEFYIGEKSKNGNSYYRRNPYLPFISTCVIQDLTVDMSNGGNYISFESTYAPVVYDIKMTLKETQIMTKETIEAFRQYIDSNQYPGAAMEKNWLTEPLKNKDNVRI